MSKLTTLKNTQYYINALHIFATFNLKGLLIFPRYGIEIIVGKFFLAKLTTLRLVKRGFDFSKI